jgi:hypothetical protein
MHSEPDVTRIVRSWLRTDEHESADRVLDDVLGLLDATPQRRSWWPAWRIADMHTYAKLGIAAAAVVVVAVVGINLLPGRGGIGGGGPAASPVASASAAPSLVATAPSSPSPTSAALFPARGPLSAGTYRAVLEGVPLSFSVQGSGWRVDETDGIGRNEYGAADFIGLDLWESAPENVYADPCAHTPLKPPPSATASGLAAAAAAIPGTDLVSGPSSVVVGGHPAQLVVLKIRDDLDCDPHDAYLWYDDSSGGASGGWHWAEGLGATYRVWIIDVDGKLIFIDAYTFKGASPEPGQAVERVIDSIQFE